MCVMFFLPEGRSYGEGASSSEQPLQLASAELSKPCRETELHPGKNKATLLKKKKKYCHISLVSIINTFKKHKIISIKTAQNRGHVRFLLHDKNR